jgi:type III secretion protein W
MMVDVGNIQNANPAFGGLGAGVAGKAESGVGKLAGFQVVELDDPLADLEDSAEEISFAMDNSKELSLKERKAKGASSSFMERVEKYQELMEKIGGQGRETDFLTFLKNNRSAQQALAQAKGMFGGDAAQMWAALGRAKKKLKGDAPDAALDAIEEALAQLEKESMGEIRAGIVGATTALEAGKSGEAALAEGAAYRQVNVEYHDDTFEMFQKILEKYGSEQFEEGLEFLFRALANDLASDQPSQEASHLEAVSRGLGQARVLNGAHTLLARFLLRWKTKHGVENAELTPVEGLKDLLEMKQDHYLSARSLEPMVKAGKAPDIEHEVIFLQELLSTARQMSPLVFDDAEGRMRFIDAVQEAVDDAVAREDDYLASLE